MTHEECNFETKLSIDILAYQNCVASKWKNGTKLPSCGKAQAL